MEPAPDSRAAEAVRTGPRGFGLVLVPGFSLMALSCAVEVLRAARLEAPDAGFRWSLLAADGPGEVISSGGVPLSAEALPAPRDFDAIAVCGGDRTHLFRDPTLAAWLKRAARGGTALGSISDAGFLLAGLGLFDGRRSTIHWKCQSAYRERHPELDIRASILEIDGPRFSCAGGTSSLDLMLQFVQRSLGATVAERIADNYVHDRLRGDEQMQRATGAHLARMRDPTLARAIAEMEARVETPLPIAEIARRTATTPRRLDRLFLRHLQVSPSQHYRDMRLTRAGGLLRQSDLPVGEIALTCGFQSASHLGRHFRARFGSTPGAYRRQCP